MIARDQVIFVSELEQATLTTCELKPYFSILIAGGLPRLSEIRTIRGSLISEKSSDHATVICS
jgi:hypothetical protein